MKIAYLIEEWPSKNETAILNQITEVINQGHYVKAFFSFNTDQLNSEELPPEIISYGLTSNIYILKRPPLNKFNNKVIRKLYVLVNAVFPVIRTFFYSPKVLFKALFKTEYGEHKKAFKIVFAIQNLLYKNLEFDIIHSQYTPLGVWIEIFKDLGLLKGKTVTSFRGYGINKLPKTKPADYYDFLINNCDAYTSNTNFTKKNAIKIGFPENKISIIHTALHTEKYTYKERNICNNTVLNILTAASLREVKGIEYAIKAIKLILDKNPRAKIHYKIAGSGSLKNSLQELINTNNLQKYIELIGFVNHNELKKIYEKTHLFILPSIITKLGNQEAQGLVLQEAQIQGIPVIGTNTGGIPEGFLNNKSGFLVEQKNPQEIANKILYFIRNPNKITEFGKIGHMFVSENFNIKNETKKLITIYKSI